MAKVEITDLSGNKLISIGEMAKKSGVSASAIRGYEVLGLLRNTGVQVIRQGKIRYYNPRDSWKIAQIKASRMTKRDEKLVRQNSYNVYH